MTKTQISVRVSPDTLAAIDAAVKATGTTRNHIIDRWLSAQSAATSSATPIEQQAWYRAGLLVAKAQGKLARFAGKGTTWQAELIDAIMDLADAIDVLAGTAPEEG